jgi:rare lipoprotein A (peptidoglycan hydrolase)
MVHINRIIVLKAVQPTLEALLAAKCMSEEVYERQKQREREEKEKQLEREEKQKQLEREREEKEKQLEREEKQKKIAGLTQRLSDPNLEPEKRRKFQDMLDDLQFGSS